MSKTAIQEMMSEIQANYPQLFDLYTQLGRSFVNDMHKYLAMEQQQIIEAFNSGQAKEASECFWTKGNFYYENKYGQHTDSNL